MIGIAVTVVVTIIAAFGAAWFGARLQRKWTPNPIPPIKTLGERIEQRIEQLSQQMESIERERREAEHFTLGVRIMTGAANHYMLVVRNDTDEDVSIETIQLFLGEAPLSEPTRREPHNDWRIPAHSAKQIQWSPAHEPTMTLRTAGVQPQRFAVPYQFVLGCVSNGKPRTVRRNVLLMPQGNCLSQWGP